MATSVNELNVWENETPVVNMQTDGEFNVWENETPVEDVDEFIAAPVVGGRRRIFIF